MLENIIPHSAKYYELPLWPASVKSPVAHHSDHISKAPLPPTSSNPWDQPQLLQSSASAEDLVKALTPAEESLFLSIEGQLLACSRKIVSLYGDSLRAQGELDLESYLKAQLFKAFIHDASLLKQDTSTPLSLEAPSSLTDVRSLYESVVSHLKQNPSPLCLALTGLLPILQTTLLSQEKHPPDVSKPLFLSILTRLSSATPGDLLA